MSKRNAGFNKLGTKKLRLDDFDDSWEEDLDENVIEDCLQRASQIETENQNVDVSVSYSFFKEPKQMVSSTQRSEVQDTYQTKIKSFQSKYAEKEGEVSILRAKLHDFQASSQLELDKQLCEWTEKLHSAEKEKNSIKTEVEFKNLEIARLRQQILKLSKLVGSEHDCSQVNKADLNIDQSVPQRDSNLKICISNEIFYPLRSYGTFKTNSYNYSDIVSNISAPTLGVLNNRGERKNHFLDVCPELSNLVNLSEDLLESDSVTPYINKVLYVSIHLLSDLLRYLKQDQTKVQIEIIRDIDAIHLKKSCTTKASELGVECGEVLEFLARLFPFSSHLRKCLFENQPITVNEEILKLDTIFSKETLKQVHLETIPEIISLIATTRKEHLCSRFLVSVLELMTQALSSGYYSNTSQISQQIFLLRPKCDVILEVTYLLKEASKYPQFIGSICFSSKQKYEAKSPNTEVCRLTVFLNVLKSATGNMENDSMRFKIESNILDFMYNIFKMNNTWLNQHENKSCECLATLYKCVIGIIEGNLSPQRKLNCRVESTRKKSIKLLHLMSSDSYSLIEKHIIVFAQFKESVYNLLQIYEDSEKLKDLEKLSLEDCPDVPSERFVGIDF